MSKFLKDLETGITKSNRRGFFPLHQAPRTAGNWVILCDFDGTISLRDVTDALLERFGMPGCEELEEAWELGHIGSRECMSGQIALMDARREELDAALAQIEIDPAFKSFVAAVQACDIPVQVVSDGLDYAIRSILQRNGLGEVPVFANHLVQIDERRWELQFPYATNDCRKASGNCKCTHVASQRPKWEKVLYVGDGSSDFCVSHEVDIVLAKHKLIDYCTQQGIAHHAIEGFTDAQDLWPTLLSETILTV